MHIMKISATLVTLFMTAAMPALCDDLAAIQKALDSKYVLTVTTANRSDIVTAGSVLVLKKSNLLTLDASRPIVLANSYKNGRITQSKMIALANSGGRMEGARTFVQGEKVWLTGIEVKEKEVSFNLFTDAYGDTRYRSKINFPIEKDSTPTVSGMLATIAEVFDIQEAEGGGGQQQTQQQPQYQQKPQQPSGAPRPPVEAPPPPIAPPPPPPADPKEIKLGQTPDQVTAAIGQPDKVVKLGTKQIYVYKDIRVVFVGGKVSDVQ